MGVKDIKKAAKGELLHQSLYMYTECGGTTPKRGVVMCAPPAHTHKTHGKKSMIFLFLFFLFQTCTTRVCVLCCSLVRNVLCCLSRSFPVLFHQQQKPGTIQQHNIIRQCPDRRGFLLVFRLIHTDGHFSHIKEHERL